MDSNQYYILWLLYNKAVYKYAIAIDRDTIPLQDEERLTDLWREPEIMEFLEGLMPDHLDDMEIVGIEEMHEIILPNTKDQERTASTASDSSEISS